MGLVGVVLLEYRQLHRVGPVNESPNRSKLSLEQREALMKDIRTGSYTMSELSGRYHVSLSTIQHYQKKANGGARMPRTKTKDETVVVREMGKRNKRVLELLARMVDRRPGLLKELDIMALLQSKHPDLLLDCM